MIRGIDRPYTPPWALTYSKNACDAGAISLYPGAAGPVSGWWVPNVMLVAVTPGAVAPPLPLLLLLLPPLLLLLLLLLLDDEPQPAATSATTAMTPTHASDLVRRKLIPLLSTWWNQLVRARTSTRRM